VQFLPKGKQHKNACEINNFTNSLMAAFMRADPKSAKKE
jgi:hypothetical protein